MLSRKWHGEHKEIFLRSAVCLTDVYYMFMSREDYLYMSIR